MKQNFVKDYVKAARRAEREEEIENYGKQIRHNKIKQSQKMYKRKKFKYHDAD